MTDVLGWRKVMAVIGPSTNTVVQPDMEAMRPPGVTNHYRDIDVENPQALSDASFTAGTARISQGVLSSLKTALSCEPDYIVMGISAISFAGGLEGATRFQRELADFAGCGVSVGSLSLAAAIAACGGIRRVALISPYYPVANAMVTRFLADCGIEVVRDVALRCQNWTAIARVGESVLREQMLALDGDDVDALLQVGTNLSMVKLAATLEAERGKPVIAINTATYWHALRACGIEDRVAGFGSLMLG